MAFQTEPEPSRGKAIEVLPGVLRITAENPGPMRYHGTNTYILDDGADVVVIDPGPDDGKHLDTIVDAAGRISLILLTHGHVDHAEGIRSLQKRTGAPLAAFYRNTSPDRVPDIALEDGSRVGSLTAIHTPGHAADHLCFARGDGVLFSGDHVMAWCSTVVGPPPNGDMLGYFRSLQRLIDRPDRVYAPGHGPLLHEPKPFVQELLDRRLAREQEILEALGRGLTRPDDIRSALYSKKTNPVLVNAAYRNVLSHLAKLVMEGRVRELENETYILA